jgi:DNA-binding NarL/FixJ family response regulator
MARLRHDHRASTLRVLVVEDHAPFRTVICSTLSKKRGFQQIVEASDGFEAVQKAQELQPDLILLDIGLPTLNGIKAAHRIREVSKKSKILFLTQESSEDVVQEALKSGARGYVIKINAAKDLIAAVDAVLRGEQFLGSGVANPSLLSDASSFRYVDKSGADA